MGLIDKVETKLMNPSSPPLDTHSALIKIKGRLHNHIYSL